MCNMFMHVCPFVCVHMYVCNGSACILVCVCIFVYACICRYIHLCMCHNARREFHWKGKAS